MSSGGLRNPNGGSFRIPVACRRCGKRLRNGLMPNHIRTAHTYRTPCEHRAQGRSCHRLATQLHASGALCCVGHLMEPARDFVRAEVA